MNEIKPDQIFYLPEAELHMMGESIAVRWNVRIERKTSIISGRRIIEDAFVRDDAPYISFVDVRHDTRSGEDYLSEDSPVDGGIGLEFAKQIYSDLGRAIAYLEQMERMK